MTNQQIGQRIQERRKELGLTMDDLASTVGVYKSTISRYENGSIDKVRLPTIESIARALGVNPSWIVGKSDDKYANVEPLISPEGQHIGVLYDRADEKDKMLTHSVLDKYDDGNRITAVNTRKSNPGGMVEYDVYDEPAAAGLGNYLDAPRAHREQFPAYMVPRGADFGVHISGDSMEPQIPDKTTVFVRQTVSIDPGKVGIFVMAETVYCKQLIVDHAKQEVRLHSFNPAYKDIIVTADDDLRTLGQVL